MKQHLKKGFKIILALLILCLLLILLLPSRTPSIEGSNSVATLEKIELNGLDQYILVRGHDKNNPILLFLHGGPGYAQISFARNYQEALEKHFIVVNWDQRGSGMSYTPSIPKNTMTRDYFIKDTKSLIDYLCEKYNKETLYLVGHSWGSELGMHVIDAYPERIAAFISIGQMVNGLENERISYSFVLDKAQKDNHTRAINDLHAIGSPPYNDIVKDTFTQRKWLEYYGGVERQVDTLKDIILGSIFSPEYTGIDGLRFALGTKFTADRMWGNNLDLDFIQDLPEVKVPIYFCAGQYDYNTPSELIEAYYEQIIAPEKALIWFESSAHFPHFEEPDKFAQVMVDIKRSLE